MVQFGPTSTPRNGDLLLLQDGEHHRAARLFNGTQNATAHIKARSCDSGFWDHTDDIPEGLRSWIVSAGFDGVLRTGYHKIDHALITDLVEKWRPETHTFHFPVGEATITLQDVQILWGLPLDGDVVSGKCECKDEEYWAQDCNDYLRFYPPVGVIDAGRIKMQTLVQVIRTPCKSSRRSYLKRARCYILALLGGHLFSDSRSYDVPLNFLKNIDDLSEGGRLSWGSAVLAYLYRQLCIAAEKKDVKGIEGPLILLHFWAWERMHVIAPRIILRQNVPDIYPHCRGSRWHPQFCTLSHTATPAHVLVTYRAAVTALEEGQFIWCPYTAVLRDLVNDCTRDSGLWAYTGWLVWWCVAEPHAPNRVCREFAFGQGVPESLYVFSVGEHKRNHEGKFSGGRATNWVEKKHDEIVCWNDRQNRVYRFNGPAGAVFYLAICSGIMIALS